jgi:FkbM family methyltransferase
VRQSMLREIDLGMFRLVNGREGMFLVNPRDRFIGQSMMQYGEFSYAETALFEQLCGLDDIVVEAGANIGAHTVGLAKRVGPTGRVIALEPQRVIFQNLCANVALNGLFNVDCLHVAASDRRQKLYVPRPDYLAAGNFGGVSLNEDEAGEPVEAWPIDELFRHDRLTLLKIDVEGMESQVLAGAARTIERFRPILYVENDRREKSRELVERIVSFGYRCWWHLPLMFNPDNVFANPNNLFPGMVSVNMLCIPKGANITVDMPEMTDPSCWPLGGN